MTPLETTSINYVVEILIITFDTKVLIITVLVGHSITAPLFYILVLNIWPGINDHKII